MFCWYGFTFFGNRDGRFLHKLRPLLIFGTRPETIKIAPVIAECQRRADRVDAQICLTGQHRELLAEMIDYFGIRPNESLDLMTTNQTLASLTARCLERIDEVLINVRPDCVVVQGDTTTAMAGALAAFYRRIPLVHVEAGLRTDNLQAPWPEELNRRITDMTASLYCAPTQHAAETLLAEGVPKSRVHVTGNTGIDALLQTVQRERDNARQWELKHPMLSDSPMVLITGHRRESFGHAFERICRAIGVLADRFAEYRFVFPVHLNPQVQRPVRATLGDRPNILLIEPVAYPEFVWLMDRSRLILTDSGGIQEEAPSLRKPLLVMRDATERPEAIEAGAARLVGTSVEMIVETAERLLNDPVEYASCQIDENPFGDGHAAERTVDLMLQKWSEAW